MRRAWAWLELLAVASLAGCCSSVEGALDSGLGTPDSGVVDAGDGGGGSDKCVVPSLVDQNLTLTRACAPWLVLNSVLVEGDAAPVLTIEPGVILAFSAGVSLSVGMNHPGGLKAIGTPIQKKQGWVYFGTASGTSGLDYWGGIVFGPETLAGSEISWADLSYAGADAPLRPSLAATIRVLGKDRPVHPRFADLTIEGSGRAVFAFVGPQSGFSADSARIWVPSWDAQNDGTMATGIALSIDPNQFETIPADLAFGSTLSGIELNCEYEAALNLPCRVDHDATWKLLTTNQLMLYPLMLDAHLVIGAPPGSGATATLTLLGTAPSPQFNFSMGSGSGIDVNSAQTNGRGNLVGDGLAFQGRSIYGPWDGMTFTVPPGGMVASSLTHSSLLGARGVGEAFMKAGIFVDGRGTTLPETGPTIENSTIGMADGGCDITWDHIANGGDYAAHANNNSDYDLQTAEINDAQVCHP